MENTALNLGDIRAIFFRRRWALFLPMCAVFWLAVAAAFLLPSIYRSQATILIEEQEIPLEMVQTTVTGFAEQRLQAIYQRIVSTPHLLDVIKKLQLYPDLQGKKTPDEIAGMMRKDIILDFVKAEIVDPKTGRPATATIAFTLAYQGKSPAVTQKVASVLTSFFLEENLKNREEKARAASDFLQDEVDRVKAAMAETDARIAAFKQQHYNDLPELLQVNMQSLHNLEMNNDRLTEQIRSQREREGFLASQVANIPRKAMKSNRLEELQLQLANLRTKYSDQYPDVIAVKAEIARLSGEKGAFQGEVQDDPAYVNLASQLAGTRAEITSLKRQIEDNANKIAEYRARIEATPKVEETYKAMVNERDNLLHKYSELMQKHMEAQVAQGLEKDQQGEKFTIVEPALLPDKPVKPNRLAIVLIGIVLGGGAGVGMAALLEFSDASIRTAERLAQATSFPVLGAIPEIRSEGEVRRMKRRGILELAALFMQCVLGMAALAAVVLKIGV